MLSFKKILPIILIIGFVLFSFVPTLYELLSSYRVKPVRYFELVHNFPTDYNLYLSKIRQGKEGAWLAKEKYTSEPHDGSLLQILYVFIGRISDMVKIQTPYIWIAYHVMRFFFAILLLFVLWKICMWVFPSYAWQLVSFLVVVTASTWPKFESVGGWPRFGGYMPWYTMVDSLQRTTFMPHVLMGQAILAFVLWVFAGGFISKKKAGNWIFLGVLGIVVGIVFPPAIFFTYLVLGAWSCIEIFSITVDMIRRKNVHKKEIIQKIRWWFVEKWFGRIVFIALTFPTMVYYALLFTYYPWKRLVEFDVINPTKFSTTEYFLSLGPTLLFGLFGIIAVLFTRKNPIAQKLQSFLVWVTVWISCIFIFNYIPQQSPTRFSQVLPHVPLGILTTYLFYTLAAYISRLYKKNPSQLLSSLLYVFLFTPIIIVMFGLGTMYSSWMWQKDFVDHKLRADYPLVPRGADVMYPLNDLIEGMIWLQNYTPRTSVVFSSKATGNLIPVYSGNVTFVGHANTVNSEIKEIVVSNFYGRKVPRQVIEDYFKQNNIKYVFYGPDEKEYAFGAPDLRPFYPFLKELYRNYYVVLYEITL
jgi:hypothetical protein